MKVFLISYDLGVPETSTDYAIIKKYVESFPKWMKPLKSQWFVASSIKSAGDIRDDFRSLTDRNDKLMVLDVTDDSWATYGFSDTCNNWLKNNL